MIATALNYVEYIDYHTHPVTGVQDVYARVHDRH